MVPTPPDDINKILIACTVLTWDNKRENRTYQVTRAKHCNGYRSSTSGGSMYYTDQNRGPNGEPITRKIQWCMQYISEFDTWEDVLQLLRMMRADNIEYIWE